MGVVMHIPLGGAPHGQSLHDTTVPDIKSGIYTGNGVQNRDITHGVGRILSSVLIADAVALTFYRIVDDGISLQNTRNGGAMNNRGVTVWDITHFHVGDNPSTFNGANLSGVVYRWVAFG